MAQARGSPFTVIITGLLTITGYDEAVGVTVSSEYLFMQS